MRTVIPQLNANSAVLRNGESIVQDALYRAKKVSKMILSDMHKQNPHAFTKEVLQSTDSLGGIKIKATEFQQKHFLKNVQRAINGDTIDTKACIDYERTGKSKMQLSDPQGSALGNYTLQLAMMYILEFGSNLDQNQFLLRKYFPDIPTTALEVQIDRGSAVYGRLNAADYNMPLPIRNRMNSYGYKYEAQRYSEEVRIQPRDMLFTRNKGTNDIADGAAGLEQLLSYETLYGVTRIETSKNLDLADSVLRNGFTYPVNSTNTLSSGIPAQNTFTFPAPVGTYDSATGVMTPNDSLDIMKVLGAMLSGWQPLIAANKYVREIIIHPLVYTAIVQNAFFQSWLKQGYVTRDSVQMEDTILRFYTIKGFDNVKFVSADTSWLPTPTDQASSVFAENQYVMGGNNTTITNASFKGFIGIDPSTQGGTLGGVLIAPDVLSGSYVSGASGYGVQVYDMTYMEPASPHLKVVPFATYTPAPWFKEAIFTVDFQVTIV